MASKGRRRSQTRKTAFIDRVIGPPDNRTPASAKHFKQHPNADAPQWKTSSAFRKQVAQGREYCTVVVRHTSGQEKFFVKPMAAKFRLLNMGQRLADDYFKNDGTRVVAIDAFCGPDKRQEQVMAWRNSRTLAGAKTIARSRRKTKRRK